MFHPYIKAALVCAVIPIGLLASGCTATDPTHEVGAAGVSDIQAGNWTAARENFRADYQNHPDRPAAVFNMGVAYQHDGDNEKANALFHQSAEMGRNTRPSFTLEPKSAGVTVADQACFRLHNDNKQDAYCGDDVAMAAPSIRLTER